MLAALALAALTSAGSQPNALVVVLDDVGRDRVGVYEEGTNPGRTPNIDGLAAQGMLFRHAWAMANCSPTRGVLLTGRYAFRTGLGQVVNPNHVVYPGLPLSEVTIAEALPEVYATAALGKWHVAAELLNPTHPNDQGFDHYAGTLYNVRKLNPAATYFRWEKTVDGVQFPSFTYITTDQADDAVAQIQALPEPWFVLLQLQAAHNPVHAPPSHLHTFNLSGDPEDSKRKHYKAMVQAADTELGRVLDVVDLADTYVFLLGDNGTPGHATQAPFDPDQAKGTLYEGGVRVPFIAAGPTVPPGTESDALVWTGDLFATLLALAGAAPPVGVVLDSVNLSPTLADPAVPHRSWLFAEQHWNTPGGCPCIQRQRAARNERWKLIRRPQGLGGHAFFDLDADPFEQDDLLPGGLTPEQQVAHDALLALIQGVDD